MENNFLFNPDENRNYQMTKVLDCNAYTKKFGVTLSEADALTLMESRSATLRDQQRVEFGEGILPKIISAFCDSAYIYQDNYLDMLQTLQDIFYLYKNESLDELSDDELIKYMREEFEGKCQGSLEYLEDTSLAEFARAIRKRSHGFLGKKEEE